MTLYNILENGNQSSVTEIRSVVIWSLDEGMIILQRGTSKILVLMYVYCLDYTLTSGLNTCVRKTYQIIYFNTQFIKCQLYINDSVKNLHLIIQMSFYTHSTKSNNCLLSPCLSL